MTKNIFNIGASPHNELCASINAHNYKEQAKKECGVFIRQLRRQLGLEPQGSKLEMQFSKHESGKYLEVVLEYDDEDKYHIDFIHCLEEASGKWDELSKIELSI